jgi:DNA-binding Xre family transcriptional regulator
MAFQFNLEKVLSELEITKNYLSRESKIRPATILDLASGETKRLELPTIEKILDCLNQTAKEKDLNKTYTIDDLVQYEYSKDSE